MIDMKDEDRELGVDIAHEVLAMLVQRNTEAGNKSPISVTVAALAHVMHHIMLLAPEKEYIKMIALELFGEINVPAVERWWDEKHNAEAGTSEENPCPPQQTVH